MPTICHFEIAADDIQRAKNFYSEMFGWEIEDYQDMEYWLIRTTKDNSGIGGGIYKRTEPQQSILNYIDVPSVEEFSAKVEKLGGKIVMPKAPVPEMGWFVICLDTENNPFGLWESDKEAK